MSGVEKQSAVRVWHFLDAGAMKKEILFIDDNYGQCGNCKQLGINFVTTPRCPACSTAFRYLAAKAGQDPVKILRRIAAEGLKLQLIERSDFEKAESRDKLSGFFTDPA